MKKLLTLLTVFFTLSCFADSNILPNGNFDVGADSPAKWDNADNLTSFWIKEKGRGRVLKLDSRVKRKQVLEYWKKRKQDTNTKPPKVVIPKEPLQSIGANEGTFIDSELIDVKKGQDYKLTVDYKGPVEPIIWIKGFLFHPRRKFYVDCYQTRLVPKKGDPKKWRTFSIGFNPTKRMPRTTKMKVRIYAYWPVAINYFDNVKIEEITPVEMNELVKLRSKE